MTSLERWLRARDMKLEKRCAGECEVVGITERVYHGTARRVRGRWVALDTGCRLREQPFPTLAAAVRFIAR